MGRKPSKNSNLPRGVRAREQRSGVIYYYYDAGGKPRREIPLGSNYVEAVRKWAELEALPPTTVSKVVTFRYACEVYQKKYLIENAPKTREEKLRQIETLLAFFDNPPAPLEEIKPIHIKQFLSWRVQRTQDVLRKKGEPVEGNEGRVAANREKSLISHIWNAARAEGLTDLPNPCSGIKSFREYGRETYVYDDAFQAVWDKADVPTREAMDLAYLTGGRPADLLKIDETHLREGSIEVRQNKTGHKLRIAIEGKLAALIERIKARKRGISGVVVSARLLVNEEGQPLGRAALRFRFEAARSAAGIEGDDFQFRDLRAKAATDKTDNTKDIRAAQQQLGHASVVMTENYVRKRRGRKVMPTE
ncbi:tyrosine-type recombinase/integrase [Herbaspirillum huttiense]|uniref:Tyrosine-type recombinase/integrase n=1 Tax=Herbaspirillum huttiense subsp. lycopersici TaxID=3074428 RepID=A0ABU2EQY0_9BURK|nr:tyrosine-type recombinase/integrase [Herbaspirillum huttiense]MDR9850227.1 tyrosine-type recombinase/integrase [Herbaspirillum huttiense SE1]